MAVNARGEALVAWLENPSSDSRLHKVWGARFSPETGWSTPSVLQDGPGPFLDPYSSYNEFLRVAIDAKGAGLVTFLQPLGLQSTFSLWGVRFEPATGWAPPQWLAGDVVSTYLGLEMNAKGETVVIWNQPTSGPNSAREMSWRWFK